MPTRLSRSLPNHLNYGLGLMEGYPESCEPVAVRGVTEGGGGLVLYPNPVGDRVNVTIGGYLPRDAKVVLYDAIGQVQKAQAVRHGRNTLRLDGLRPGIYFYEITEKGVLLGGGRLVKM